MAEGILGHIKESLYTLKQRGFLSPSVRNLKQGGPLKFYLEELPGLGKNWTKNLRLLNDGKTFKAIQPGNLGPP